MRQCIKITLEMSRLVLEEDGSDKSSAVSLKLMDRERKAVTPD